MKTGDLQRTRAPNKLRENLVFFRESRYYFWTRAGVLCLATMALLFFVYARSGLAWDMLWLQTGILAVSAIAAVALFYQNGKQVRIQTLTNLIVRQRANEELQKAIRQITAWRKTSTPLIKFLDSDEARNQIMRVLNHHEFIAVGIRLGAFDERTYKTTNCGIVTRLWDDAEEFINAIRQQRKSNTPFQDLERIAKHWKRNPLKPLKPFKATEHPVQAANTEQEESAS